MIGRPGYSTPSPTRSPKKGDILGENGELSLRSPHRAATFSPPKIDNFSETLGVPESRSTAAVDLKVLHPYEHKEGSAPRRVLVERKKKHFESQRISDLLKTRGVDYSDASFDKERWLPLDPFDDHDFDAYSPKEWIELGYGPDDRIAEDGVQPDRPHGSQEHRRRPLAAVGLRSTSDGAGNWEACSVHDYDEKDEKFKVIWKSDNKVGMISRLSLCFEAEDPALFADRVAKCHKSRRTAESLIRYQFYIDNMPDEEIFGLDSDQVMRIKDASLNTKSLRDFDLDITGLFKEVHLDFTRAMNKITFDEYIKNNPDDPMLQNLVPPEPEKQSEVPWYALIPVADHSFTESFSQFCFSTLYIKEQVIHSLQEIRRECDEVLMRRFFITAPTPGGLSLEDYNAKQKERISIIGKDLTDGWTSSIKTTITTDFEQVGKGWFNLHDVNKDTYQFGKLRKILTVVRLMMQDTLRFMVWDSLEEFSDCIRSNIPYKVDIHSVCEVVNYYDETALPPRARPLKPGEQRIPLFSIQLTHDKYEEMKLRAAAASNGSFDEDYDDAPGHPTAFKFGTDPKLFVSCVNDLIFEALTASGKIQQPERIILPNLIKTKAQMYLPTVSPGDQKFSDYSESLSSFLSGCVEPLERFIQTFDKFIPFLTLDSDAFVKEIESRPEPVDSVTLKLLVDEKRAEEEMIRLSIPDVVHVGCFNIHCSDIRALLMSYVRSTADKLLDLLCKRLRVQCNESLEEFHGIQAKFKKNPASIEVAVELETEISKIPGVLSAQQKNIEAITDTFDTLELFRYRMSDEMAKMRWNVFRAPKDVKDLVALTQSLVEKERKILEEQMIEEQKEFDDRLETLAQTIDEFQTYSDPSKTRTFAANAKSVEEQLKEALEQSRLFNSREGLFNRRASDYSRVQQLQKKFEPFGMLWITSQEWEDKSSLWRNGNFDDIDANDFENVIINGLKNLLRTTRMFRERDLPDVQRVSEKYRGEVESWKPYIPLVLGLRNSGMRDRHWQQVSTLVSSRVGIPINPEMENFSLAHLIELGVHEFADELGSLGERAGKEYNIEQDLNRIKAEWDKLDFDVKEPYKKTGTYIIKGADIIRQVLDDHCLSVQNMMFSPFRAHFEDIIVDWNEKLQLVTDCLEMWLKVQAAWMYLQPIFDSEDISRQIPQEAKKFRMVEGEWKNIMKITRENPNVLTVCTREGLLNKFTENNSRLESVQKGLSEYLETKRQAFARFYFLSEDELLEILSQTKDPTRVQPHLRKVFENMDRLTFEADLSASAMSSVEGESVDFSHNVITAKKNVEHWMTDVEAAMRGAVRRELLDAIESYSQGVRTEWVLEHPGQTVINGSQVHWTNEVEQAILDNEVGKYFIKLNDQIQDMVHLVRSGLNNMHSITCGALIVIDVHAKDVVEKLKDENIQSITEFEWISQLRYYWNDDDCYVHCVQTEFPYGYEYLGNTPRLVITPLTDKCYMTLMGAQQLHLGGAPAGPAGTGKTETTKDLGKALAMQCVVFNCSDTMGYEMVAKFFKGLAMSGAWVCFDEFNRINVEVLSVIAQQLNTLFDAKKATKGYKDFAETEFHGSTIKVYPSFNVFITMNPGYAGRKELPDNLKALFRPMAMMVPDYALIGEIMLYSFGFSTARELAKKKVATFKLCSEQLSSQDHYDYGMRAVRSVINAAGLLKRQDPDMPEDQLLLRALEDVNVPKFLEGDLELFKNIIMDLFPGISRPQIDLGPLLNAISVKAEARGLRPVPKFVSKVVQLYDTCQVRHGLMLVGPTGGGKTSNYRVLADAMSSIKGYRGCDLVRTHVLNPKAIKQIQMYGYSNLSGEWVKGVLHSLMDIATRDESTSKHWIMFDGPVDAVWIEDMNTVLDDNKKLCLNNGAIIKLTPHMTMMFEVEDLAVASPATVSRCGMVYMEPEALGTDPLIDSWIIKLKEIPVIPSEVRDQLKRLFDLFVDDSLYFVRRECKELVTTKENSVCLSLLRCLDCFYNHFRIDPQSDRRPPTKDEIDNIRRQTNDIFVYSLMWSIGATINTDSRGKFNNFVLTKLQSNEITVTLPGCFGSDPLPDGEVTDLYGCVFDMLENKWIHWLNTIETYQVPQGATYDMIVVPSIDSIRYSYITKTLLRNNFHVLCPGPTGTGKTVNINELLQRGMDAHFQSINISFSAETSENQTQDLIDGKLDRRMLGVYGPPAGKTFILFVDDLNMPKKEKYGAQPPLELLRQWFDHGGWYDREQLTFRKIVDMTQVAAMGPPGGGRTFVSNRVLRHYNMLTYTDISDAVIKTIFSTSLSYFLKDFSDTIQNMTNGLVASMLSVYNTVCANLLPTPSKSHYTFNLRDIWKVFQGVCSLNSKATRTADGVIRCWVHEVTRVFGDRLVSNEDRDWLRNVLLQLTTTNFEMDESIIFCNERLIFGDFMTDGENRPYEEIANMQALKKMMEDKLEDYNNNTTRGMPLVMFLDACEHVARICRVLRQPNGNALLLGVGGSGRQSLTRLASFIMDSDNFQIEVKKGYRMSEWQEKLKEVMMKCGVEDKVHTFLLVDTQIVIENMLEDINSVLNSGDVPNLYKSEDEESILSSARTLCTQMNLAPTKSNLFSCYLQRVKKNIHVVLAMSPVSNTFRTRLRMFPSLVNCCTIDWFAEWPAEALYSVAKQQIAGEEDLNLPRTEDTLHMFKMIHQSVEFASLEFLAVERRHNYVTPTSYLELLSTFKNILGAKRKHLNMLRKRFSDGLDMLYEAEGEVAKLQDDLEKKKPILDETVKQTEISMKEVDKETAEANIIREAVQKEQAAADADAAEAASIEKTATDQLAESLPMLLETLKCLDDISPGDFSYLNSLAKPPPPIACVFDALADLLGLKPIEDKATNEKTLARAARNYMSEPRKAVENLKTLKDGGLEEKNILKVKRVYLSKEEFQPEAVKRASPVAFAIRNFICAMVDFFFIDKNVQPLREAAKKAKENAEAALSKARAAQSELDIVSANVDALNAKLEKMKAEQKALQEEIKDCEVKLDRANKLTSGLSGEKVRWGQNVKDLEKELGLVPGNSLIAAGMVAYMGPFIARYREQLEGKWRDELVRREIDHTPHITMRDFLGDPVDIRKWIQLKLPSDTVSIENGIIMANARRWPLMIDPQKQANLFIKRLAAGHECGFVVSKLSEDYMKHCEQAVQFGKWVILENIGEELDPSLDPILLQQVVKEGSGLAIRFPDRTVSYSRDFRFFMTTTLPNPHYAPELQVKVSLLNFAITPIGLEEQMLATVVQFEAPQLEAAKNQQMQSLTFLKNELKRLEDLILSEVERTKSTPGGVLADESLIGTLADAKETSTKSTKQLEEAEKTNKEIDAEREKFRPVAYRASLLFFCITELANLDPMYQYSLQWYQQLFEKGIENAQASSVLQERLLNLNDSFTHLLYQNICRSLFEKHKPLFSFAMTIKVMQGDNNVDNDELRFLLTGQVPNPPKELKPNPSTWLDRANWIELQYLSSLPAFNGLDDFFIAHTKDFKEKVFDFVDAHRSILPSPWEESLGACTLRKLCFLRTMRMDKLVNCIFDFVTHEMGVKYMTPPTFDLKESFNDSSAQTPLILILSPGSDPVGEIKAFAQEMGMQHKLTPISLGDGQGDYASKAIDENITRGGWILLQNCHLAISWMSQLEAKVEKLSSEQIHPEFRLWLTSMPDKDFSVAVLQNGVKMTNEPPRGLMKNLERSYRSLDDRILDDSKNPVAFKRLLFGFCFFHAIVQDRRKFGPIGWNIAYDFTSEDLMVCRRQLKIFLDSYDYVPYKVLNYLGAQINYGGRVTDAQDKRLISFILKTYITPELVDRGADYKFSESGVFFCPDVDDQAGFLQYIEGLPSIPPPEAFGLHENANITFANNEALDLLEGMTKISSRAASTKNDEKEEKAAVEEVPVAKTKEQVQDDTAKSLLKRTPPAFDIDVIAKAYPTLYEESINTVLVQECVRYNRLLVAMSSQLKEFIRALKGEVVMSGELEKLGNALYDNAVPDLWAPNVGFLSLKPLFSWLEDLEKRVEFLNDWIAHGTPVCCWISGLFFPQAFLTGVMQNYARAHTVAIDQLSFEFKYVDTINDASDIKAKPEDGCYIHGIYLEGARWDFENHYITDSKPKILYDKLPVVHLIPTQNKKTQSTGFYECPIYKVLSRAGTLSTTGHSTNFVMALDMPTKDIEDKWIKAGVAGFLALRN